MKHTFYLCSLFLALGSFHASASVSISNLRVEYLKNPVGIDAPQPQFSWQMQSDETGQRQTAYQITLFSVDNAEIWTSGKIASDISVGIKYGGATLAPSTRYLWKVSVWDKNDVKITSAEDAFFETGLMQSGWSGAQWLKVKEKQASSAAVNFTLSCDMTVIDQNAGVIFGAKDLNTMYMWAINTYQVSHPILRRHVFVDGNVTYVQDIPLPAQFTAAQILNHERRLKIDVVNNVINTYLDDILVDAYSSPDLRDGYIGFRVYTGDNNTHEHAYIDNVEYIYFENGAQHTFTETFENGSNDFDGVNTILVDSNTKMNLFAPDNADLRVLQSVSQGTPMFRAEFQINKTVKSARIYSSALGVYDLWVNGSRVGAPQADGTTVYDEFKSGWTDYRKTVFYTTYDITNLLVTGQNAVGANLSSGWFTGGIAHNEYGQHPLGFIAKILLEYADGTSQSIVTNTNAWKASINSPVLMADIYNGENYDARRETAWTSANFNDAAWTETAVNDYFTGDIMAFIGQTVRVRKNLEQTPKTVTVYNGITPNGTTHGEINIVRTFNNTENFSLSAGETAIIDFGQNIVGWIKFRVTGAGGAKIRARFAEMLNDSGAGSRGNDGAKGTLYLINLRSARATLNYTLRGDAAGETFNPAMTFFGFRYAEISASQDVTFEMLKGEVVGNANEENSSFATNNDLVNKLYSNVLWGQRGNFLSVPTDCPQRDERLGWMGDTQIFSRAAAYNADVASFFHKWAKDLRDGQRADGSYPQVVPYTWNVGYGATAWAEAGVIVPYNMYLMYGDREILSQNFASMEQYMAWLAAQRSDGLTYSGGTTQYGDWVAYVETDRRFISVCYYALAARLMAKISNVLSVNANDVYAQKAASYQTLYNNIKTEFQNRYVNSRTGYLFADTQTAYLLALQNDLFSNTTYTQNAVNRLVQLITNNGNKLNTGFVGTGILNQTLSEFGADDAAYNLLLQRQNPSWLYSVVQGATTIWERWNSYTLESGFHPDITMNSFNHYSYGAVAEWMFRFMAGIETDENNAGFKHFILQPKLDLRNVSENERITNVNAEYGSYYGQINSKWEHLADGNYRYTFVVPANTSATLYIPKLNDSISIFHGNLSAENVEGVSSFASENKRFTLELQSGAYTFETRNVSATGASNIKKKDEITLYPNPVKKWLVVSGQRLNDNVEIYDIQGKIVLTDHLSSTTNHSINVSHLSSGIYFIKIDDKVVKFSKE